MVWFGLSVWALTKCTWLQCGKGSQPQNKHKELSHSANLIMMNDIKQDNLIFFLRQPWHRTNETRGRISLYPEQQEVYMEAVASLVKQILDPGHIRIGAFTIRYRLDSHLIMLMLTWYFAFLTPSTIFHSCSIVFSEVQTADNISTVTDERVTIRIFLSEKEWWTRELAETVFILKKLFQCE